MADTHVQEIMAAALEELARARSSHDVEHVRVKYLGKKGVLTLLLRSVPRLPANERPIVGREANEAKAEIESEIERRLAERKAEEHRLRLQLQKIDLTLPGRRPPLGTIHPLNRVLHEIIEIFLGLGFAIAEGPEVESDFYNFEALNIPKDHPARDMQDTFYLSGEVLLLRTHTSPVQIRTMMAHKPPVRIICPGKVYRRDADITHSPMFHQVEGLAVDKAITMGDLKGTLALFAREMFGSDAEIRFRPSFFPFTEPSAEVDVRCFFCRGDGCRVCKQSGWLEIGGSGMVHPQVLRNVGYDSEEVTGWAFGMGVERIAMLKYGIDDIRLFFEGDLRFLGQF